MPKYLSPEDIKGIWDREFEIRSGITLVHREERVLHSHLQYGVGIGIHFLFCYKGEMVHASLWLTEEEWDGLTNREHKELDEQVWQQIIIKCGMYDLGIPLEAK